MRNRSEKHPDFSAAGCRREDLSKPRFWESSVEKVVDLTDPAGKAVSGFSGLGSGEDGPAFCGESAQTNAD